MPVMIRLLKWIATFVLAAVAIVLVVALGILLFVALTPTGSQIAAERISGLVSTPDRIVSFSPPEGLLSGDLRIEALTLSDERGTYASGRAHVWTPITNAHLVFC